MNNNLTEIELAILRMVAKGSTGSQAMGPYIDKRIVNMRFDPSQAQQVAKSIENLQKIFYITDKIQGSNSRVWTLTPMGESALDSQQNIEINSFSNITNSAISHKSLNVTQTINIQELAPDIVEQVNEFDSAVDAKDPNRMKAAFSYIADKAVDVAIALATGSIIR